MTGRRYTIVESVGSRIEGVNKYEDLAKHHPSSGRERNREYETIHNQLEEVRHSNGRTLIKKDFVLLVNNSNRSIPVPSPLTGYAKTSRSYGTVKILDAPTNGKLLGQVLHLDPAFKVKDGDPITYGQHIGIQAGTGAAGTNSYAIHVHAELEEADFKRYIDDLLNGTLNPDDPTPNAAASPATSPAATGWVHPCAPKAGHAFDQLTALSKAKGGFYPVGTNGLWHGGIHFDSGTKDAFEQSSVQCITAGEVIAYRVDENYPITVYNEQGVAQTSAPFSTAFALVKHILQPPAPPPAGQGQAAQPPSITLYSLYMHLKCWSEYSGDDKLARPVFWEASSYTVNTQRDPLTVRAAPQDKAASLGKISKGTKIRASGTGAYLKLEEIISGNTEPTLKTGTEAGVLGYLSSALLKAERQPKAIGSVVILDPPVPIQAGELIGHLGKYQTPGGESEAVLHVEVFSCDDLPGFISQSRAWAAQLPAKDKSLLKVHKGASLLAKHVDGVSASSPPKTTPADPKIGVDLLIPQALLDGLPATHKISVNTPASNGLPAKTTKWWRLENLLADEAGNPISGWLAEEELITTRHNPWEWEGFQLIEETGKPIDKLAYNFNARGLLTPEEQQNYRAQINKTDGGPTVAATRVYEIVDSDNDGVLTSAEIRTALSKPWHAQALGQIVTRYESEWFWNAEKWNELDPLLASENGQKNLVWEKEKERIEQLSWWGDLAGKQGIIADGKAWHVNPVFLVNQLTKINDLINIDSFITAYSASHIDFNTDAIRLNEQSKKNLRNIVEQINAYYKDKPSANIYELAYMFATARHEAYDYTTGNYFSSKPEIGKVSYFNKYDPVLAASEKHRKRAIHYENTAQGDGYKYRGRGLVHLTWKVNYRKAKEYFGIDFVTNPDLAADYKNSVPIMIWGMKEGIFTNRKLSQYINKTEINYERSRQVINGTDKSLLIASYAERFEHILQSTSTATKEFSE